MFYAALGNHKKFVHMEMTSFTFISNAFQVGPEAF